MKTPTLPKGSSWMLLLTLSACLTPSARADCGADCAFCAQLKDINSIECVLECEERVNAGSFWSLCKPFMEKAEANQEAKHLDAHRVDKKYGGFMKRYGGFMKKMAELYGPEDVQQSNAILTNHDVEVLTNQVEADSEREAANAKEGGVMGVAKRYGGFMKRAGLYELRNGARLLYKRYGGFMRRVGQPQWWDKSKRFLNRSQDQDEHSSGIEKRYGGFMGF
ncbi:proenkephalin b [Pseudorasbora parva]|uniref:proenkephalin b n=1 Tax=Pseudorasbora parva TaxID=51549 RepID=UPI00351E4BD8